MTFPIVLRSYSWNFFRNLVQRKFFSKPNQTPLVMAQRSITSFFSKTSYASSPKDSKVETEKTDTPVNGKGAKRRRSTSNENVSPKPETKNAKKSSKKKTLSSKTQKEDNAEEISKMEVIVDNNKSKNKENIENIDSKRDTSRIEGEIKSTDENATELTTTAEDKTNNGSYIKQVRDKKSNELPKQVKKLKASPKQLAKKKKETAVATSNKRNIGKSETANEEDVSDTTKDESLVMFKASNKSIIEGSDTTATSENQSHNKVDQSKSNFASTKRVKTMKKEVTFNLADANNSSKPNLDVDDSTVDKNFKLVYSDDDSPIKAKKKVKKVRVSSSSSEEAVDDDNTVSPKVIKLDPSSTNPTAVHSFFTKKSSMKAETGEKPKEAEKGDNLKSPADTKVVQKNWLIGSNESATKDVGVEYSPSKAKYDPIKDAIWNKGEPIPYLALARTLEEIENTSARLKIVDILSNFFRSSIVLTPEDLLPSVYLCLNKLAPAYESMELGVAETYLMKAVAQATGRKLGQVKTLVEAAGDLGLAAERARGAQMIMRRPPPLTVQGVIKGLREVAKMTGHAAMTKKINKIQTIFVACRHSEARYFIRSLAGKLRIGLAEQSVLQALAQAASMTPPNLDILDASKGVPSDVFKATVDANALLIKTTYCELPNYDIVIPTLLEHGVAALPEKCKLTPGVPLKPMLAHPTKGVHEIFQRFEGYHFTCEWKYDGERAQIHVPERDGKVDLKKAKIFSRNQEDNTTKYPDVLSRLEATLRDTVVSCVLDCEAVAWDQENSKILPFQILSTRKRKDASVAEIKVQVCLFMFDLLYLNGRSLVAEPLEVRRQLLRDNFKEIKGEWCYATSRDCTTIEEVQEFLEESVKGSCEGLMVKTLLGKDATYQIAKRSKNWLKLKKDYLDGVGDTIDAVVIGGYKGRGKRAGVYGGFLLACYDPDTEEYQSLCKIGTGFSDEDLQNHADTLKQYITDGPRSYYRYDSSHNPDEWFSPSIIWEIRCADLSISPVHCAARGHIQPDKGISLRFPRFVRIRDDKSPEEATSASQIARIYSSQDQVKNSASSFKENADDDFY